ncbi:MAG: alcohol dehydrogenase [Lentisphaerae bacterium RIFOXYB12_FULL_60_10]|nr:MAG: alcohol dehydrogenase [Lentisphaerae bacterium RIFOXYB12_FULL_60_10]
MSILERFSLAGKTALLTGGAGLYGRQLVAALVEAGADTYIASRQMGPLEAVAAEHRARGERVTALPLDQGDEASIQSLCDAIIQRSGRIDVLVNNAVSRPMKQGWEDDSARFDESMHVNATGLFMVTRIVGHVMERQQAGSIINIGSMMGMVGVEPLNYTGTTMHGWYPDYFFHKGGMVNFTRFCASYFGQFKVRVNCVSPGGFQMPQQDPRFVKQYAERTQLGRMANDTDLQGILVFLASDASAYITGTNIPVDGGYTAK